MTSSSEGAINNVMSDIDHMIVDVKSSLEQISRNMIVVKEELEKIS